MVALVSGHPAIAEFAGGVVILSIAVKAGARLARRAAREIDPDREMILDGLLVLVVVLGLIGVTLIGLTVPRPG